MFKLLVLIDGSIYAQSVLAHAAWIASRRETKIDVLHVLGRSEISSAPKNLGGSLTPGARTSLLQELSSLDEDRAKLGQKRGRLLLDDAKMQLEALGVSDANFSLRLGEIVETVNDTDADMILMGKRGEAADFESLHLGSNLERVVRATTKYVFVASRAFKDIKRVLIAYDGGPSSKKAVEHISRSPTFAGLELRLLSVSSDVGGAQNYLDQAAAVLAKAGLTATTEIRQGQPEAVIGEIIDQGEADFLVMGAYGHSRIRNLIIGSTTSEMLRSCKVPVALYR